MFRSGSANDRWKVFPAKGWNTFKVAEKIAADIEIQHKVAVAREIIEGGQKRQVESFVCF